MAALKNLNGYEMQNHILNRVFLLINSFKKNFTEQLLRANLCSRKFNISREKQQ